MNTGKKKYILFLMFICFHVLLAGPVFAGDTAHPWYRLQGELPAIIESVDENIIYLAPEDAGRLVNELEIMQKLHLPEIEKKYFNSRIQEKMQDLYLKDFDLSGFNEMDKIEFIPDQELREILRETNMSGYRVETAEGMFFPVIDYEFYRRYLAYLGSDFREYIEIMSLESSEPPAKDAALVIGWDEVIERALRQEKFLISFPESSKVPEVKNLYEKYLSFIFFGLNNTPLFAYDTKEMHREGREVYAERISSNIDSTLLEYLAGFLEILEENNYLLTKEVDNYRKAAIEDIFFSYKFYYQMLRDYMQAMQRNIDLLKEESNIQKINEANYGDMYQQTVALKVTEDELLFAAVDIVFTGNYKGHFTPGKAYSYYLDAAMGGQRGIIIKDNFGIWHAFGWRVLIE